VGTSGIDGGVHCSRSVIINSADVDWIAGTIEPVVRQPPQLTSVEYVYAVVVGWDTQPQYRQSWLTVHIHTTYVNSSVTRVSRVLIHVVRLTAECVRPIITCALVILLSFRNMTTDGRTSDRRRQPSHIGPSRRASKHYNRHIRYTPRTCRHCRNDTTGRTSYAQLSTFLDITI